MRKWMVLIILGSLWVALQSEGVSARGIGASPPAGLAPATAPGGTQGIAGPRNTAEAIQSGQAYAVQPGGGGVKVYRTMPGAYSAGPRSHRSANPSSRRGPH